MSDKAIDKLDPRVLIIVLFMGILEFEIFTFSRTLIEIVGQASWISILFGFMLLLANTYILVKLASRFPKQNLFVYLKKVWGRHLSFIITVSYLLYWLVFLTILFKEFSVTNRVVFLRDTPIIVPLALMGIGVIWLVAYGVTAIVRFFQLMFPFVIVFLSIISVLGISEMRFSNFLPLLDQGFLPILTGAIVYLSAFQGLEVILFLSPY